MRLTIRAFFFALAAFFVRPAGAQDIHTPPQFTEVDVKGAIADALRILPQVPCGMTACVAPTPEEFASPPITVEDARIALRTGAKSAQFAWCGLDWATRTYAFMMHAFSQKYGSNLRALALLRMVHAMQHGRDYTNLQVLKTCSPETREALADQNPPVIPSTTQQVKESMLRDEAITKLLQLALDKIPEAQCGKNKRCAPATPEERAHPPLSPEDARRAVTAGLLSGAAEHCGLDWKKRVFLPMMAHQRQKAKMKDRQLAMIGVMHGAMQSYMLAVYKQRGELCSQELRADVEKEFSRP